MKTLQITLLILCLITLNANAQRATLGGHADTIVSKHILAANLCLEIEGYTNADIWWYEVTFGITAGSDPYKCRGKCMDDKGRKLFSKMLSKQKLYIDGIVAYSDGSPLKPKPFYVRLE